MFSPTYFHNIYLIGYSVCHLQQSAEGFSAACGIEMDPG